MMRDNDAGMLSGAVALQAPGRSATSSRSCAGGNDNPYKARNAIPVVGPYDVVAAGVLRLRELIDLESRVIPPRPGGSASGQA